MSGWRLPDGGAIDRAQPVRFTFDDRSLTGFAGDTVASALLANGVDVVARSIKLGRPRGIVAAGADEPNALVAVEPGLGLRRATEVELVEGLAVRSVSGRAPVPLPDDHPGEHVWAHAEVVVVGGGGAGISAARDALARRAGRVVLIEGGPPVAPLPPDLAGAGELRFLPRTVAIGRFDANMILAHERRRGVPGAGPDARDRLWHIRSREVVLATGAVERPIVFADNDRPGIMLAGAVGVYLRRYGVAAGRRAVVFTTNDSAYAVARDLQAAGVEIAAIVDSRDRPGPAADGAVIAPLAGHLVVGTDGDDVLTAVHVAPRERPGETHRIEADLLAVSGGWDPALRLYTHTWGRLRYDPAAGAYVAGDLAAEAGLRIVGMAAAVSAADPAFATPAPVWLVEAPDRSLDRHFVDLQRDATAADLRRAVDAGLRSPEHVKRFTTIGTGNDQGRTSGVNEVGILATLLGTTPEQLGPTSFRTPLVPVPMRVLGGPYRGQLFDPIRTTPMHASHEAMGALFENVGQWKRAWTYPGDGESFEDAVLRECRAVREGVGIMDVSTLGKIDIQGPDAGAFLDRVYTNTFSTLKVGHGRYGLMLRSDGMVFDDGTTTRLADQHWLMTTTTGGAAAVLDWLEEWLQTEWTDLDVRLTSVTDEWAGVAIAGPRSRELLARLAPGLDLRPEAFPFMTVRTEAVAGLWARIFRISFSGELGYEVYVRSWYGRALWDAIAAAGADLGVTPYGTEAMHVLRAEKGYVIVGQETDGTVTPGDLGLDGMVSRKKWFLGRHALDRPHMVRPDRRQLVGLLPVDPATLVPEGAPLVDGTPGTRGHVTSSYRSAVLGRTFGLGLLVAGRSRVGERVEALVDGRRVPLEVTAPVFWDPRNERRDG